MELTRGLLPLAHGIAPRHPLLEESGTRIAATSFGSQLGLVAHGTGCSCRAHRQSDQNGYQCKTEDRALSWHLTFLSCGDSSRGDTIRAATQRARYCQPRAPDVKNVVALSGPIENLRYVIETRDVAVTCLKSWVEMHS
jgi:hypothetical protein